MSSWCLRIRAPSMSRAIGALTLRFCLPNLLRDRPEHLDARVDPGGRQHRAGVVKHGDAPVRDGAVEPGQGEPMHADALRQRDLALGDLAPLVDEQEVGVVGDLGRGIEAAVEIAVPVDHVLLPFAVRRPSAALPVDRALEHVGRRDLVQGTVGRRRVGERLESLGGEEARNGVQVGDVAQVVRMPLREAGGVRERHLGDVDQPPLLRPCGAQHPADASGAQGRHVLCGFGDSGARSGLRCWAPSSFRGNMPMPSRPTAISILILALLMSPIVTTQAADLKAIAGGGIAGPLRELGPAFERASGHKIAFQFGTTPELIKLATGGEPFDLAVTPREVFADAGAKVRFVAGPVTEIARVGLGVAVRAGAPRPDIGTPDALKAALLKAQSIATIPASAAGAQILRLFDRFGIGEAMKARTKAVGAPAGIVEALVKGEAQLGVFLTNTFMASGVELVGPFPAEVQQEVFYIAAVAADARDANAAKAFLSFLTTGAAAAVIKAKGMEPAGL